MKYVFLIITALFMLFCGSGLMANTSTTTNEQIYIYEAHAYPNPFDNEKEVSKISFLLHVKKAIDDVSIGVIIYDYNGVKVWTKKASKKNLTAGTTPVKVLWGGENDMGDKVANGLYYAKIIIEGSNTKIEVVKILVK